ncbi:Solute carrier family 22 member 10 [Camelus dromedarius]|uniref:Solute carrier family 22 member 10 n=1 Tax=Camelus dromedarius TaxID=9838 RepID=A0A5N4DM79_CAMDR|nr:Solute carrier family 22 member 10 [Camelus dromedarius]
MLDIRWKAKASIVNNHMTSRRELTAYVCPSFIRWLAESARWLIVTNKPDKGLKELKKFAQRNGIKNAEETLNMEGLRSAMQEELEAAQTKTTMFDLFRTPNLRKRICLLLFVRFANTVPFYGISLNLQHFGSNIFLFQVIFGALTTLVRSLVPLALKYMGRLPTQTLLLFLMGLSILVNIFVSQGERRLDFRERNILFPILQGFLVDTNSFSSNYLVSLVFLSPEMQTLRVTLASVGISFAAASITTYSVQNVELIPTLLRYKSLWILCQDQKPLVSVDAMCYTLFKMMEMVKSKSNVTNYMSGFLLDDDDDDDDDDDCHLHFRAKATGLDMVATVKIGN